jgi:hypothetical protein
MTKIRWRLLNNRTSTYYENILLSASYNYGRQGYLDNYPGSNINITIKNQANESANFQLNDWLSLIGELSSSTVYNQSFWLNSIDFNDYPGNTGLSTATLIASDAMARVGRTLGNSASLSAGTTGSQIDAMDTKPSWPPNIVTYADGTSSQASAATVTSSWNNQINLLQQTEKGITSWSNANNIVFQGRAAIANFVPPSPQVAIPFSGTASATSIGYQTFDRIGYGENFVNSAEITPVGLGTFTGTNSTSISLYGQNGITQSTVDADATQGQGNADWTASVLSDATILKYQCGFSDVSQNQTGLLQFLTYLTGFIYSYLVTKLTFRVPGASSDTTVDVVVEGFSFNITPEQTSWIFYLSPLVYYQFFTLNSSTLGILDTSRLGW